MSTKNIQKLRQNIDLLDKRIVTLLNERTEMAIAIGKEKARSRTEVFSPAREQKIYAGLRRYNAGPLPADALQAIYREIMSATVTLQKPLQVAYLGPMATFTHVASLKKFGHQVSCLPVCTITDVFNEVQRGSSDYGVVPVENSIEGAVNHTLDMFVDSDLNICSEIFLDISHALMARCGMSDIKRVYSKAEVFGQCRAWLESHLPNREFLEVSSTTRAAEIAAEEKHAAAIGNSLAAQVYALNILAESIEDSAHNFTRFLVIGRTAAERTGADKTSLMFSVKDRAGALHDMLSPFKKAGINLTKIESRPSKKKAWAYYFFVDFLGHADDGPVKQAIAHLERKCQFVKILGSYPLQTGTGG